MPERRKLLINHYKAIGPATPIRYDNLPDPETLDPVFQWWTPENYPNYVGETDPYNKEIRLYQANLKDNDPDKINIPYWDIGSVKYNKSASLKFLDVGDYIGVLKDNKEQIKEKFEEFYDKLILKNRKLQTLLKDINNTYTPLIDIGKNNPLKTKMESFIKQSLENKDSLDKEIIKPQFDDFKKFVKAFYLKNNNVDNSIKETNTLNDKAMEFQDRFVQEGSAEVKAPIPPKSDTSNLKKPFKTRIKYESSSESEGSGKKGMSKKAILNILKSKTTKSSSAIKNIEKEILNILNS